MLKKILLTAVLGAVLTLVLGLYRRFSHNPESVLPLPYKLSLTTEPPTIEAPIMIVGDRIGARFALFSDELAKSASVSLTSPIKIQSIAQEKEGLHRTLARLKQLSSFPQILIYVGGSEEGAEEIMDVSDIKTIKKNFLLYQKEEWQTLMILYPKAARFIYQPMKLRVLGDVPEVPAEISDGLFQTKLEILFQLYEIELRELVRLAREKKSLLILTTTPINLDALPHKTCLNAQTSESSQKIGEIRKMIVDQDYKNAYQEAKTLSETSLGNAEAFYLYGQVATRTGRSEEAKTALTYAAAFDCHLWRGSPVFNSIIRKIASEENVMIFDFAQMLEDERAKNVTFFDDILPQELYFQKMASALGVVLKKVLRL